MKLTEPNSEGHFRPVKAYLMEYEQVGAEIQKGPRRTLLTRIRLYLTDLSKPK